MNPSQQSDTLRPVVDVYIDGSFRNGLASWALAVVENNKVLHKDFGLLSGEVVNMRQIGGELKSAMMAIQYARSQNLRVHLYYDYAGIYHWVGHLFQDKRWKAKNRWTQQYVAYVERNRQWLAAMTKVKSHSGNRWNEYVDGLCAKAIQGVPSEASIRSLALEVLGDADQVELWMGQALPALGGKTPADCLGDRDGPVQVERVLRAIQWGIYL